jgi:hypothetical protein
LRHYKALAWPGRVCGRSLDFGDDPQDVRGVTARIGLEGGCGGLAGGGDVRIAEFLETGLYGALRGFCVAKSGGPNALVAIPLGRVKPRV